ncbi:aminotransferase class V-fold PLP-dependent enzyme [Actinokineospora sp. UTMC 2448]|uniref:aminotransferase class V-fold PLP-dependent enzyme n=1 Tax=Actinokineospora sp. UTMC 2448 TaxID=2268449 RepID=UPI00216498E6|nr:aminotransferase class V-fold PLP-dependent enzyme [Actinokineospora sp. UTMC 2448]UVS80920.1 Cysteine desulfurase [Actinokineospora sp. UTMC 2448]
MGLAAHLPDQGPPAVVGAGQRVPLIDGRLIDYANLDHAASAPSLAAVRAAVDELLPWYAGVHRGAGFPSRVSTRVYENARDALRRFVGAGPDAAVVFTRNTTDSLNLLARALPSDPSVVLFDTEHHAALLPWRGARHLRTPDRAEDAVDVLDRALAERPACLVVLTGASNVTGEVWPVAALAEVAHRHGARVVLDAAQLAPHRPVDITALGVDYVALSGHKLYAPFGVGALVGPGDWLQAAEPYLVGGGATKVVGDGFAVTWSDAPHRHEAGSPNVVGVHAMAVACTTLAGAWEQVVAHEETLLARLRSALAHVPGLTELALFGPDHDRVGVVSFTLDGVDAGLAAAVLSAEHGIGVRDGAFCAHIAVRRLAGRARGGTQAVRASVGLGTAPEHVDRLGRALRLLVARGPRAHYEVVDGRWSPVPDPRPLPRFLAA